MMKDDPRLRAFRRRLIEYGALIRGLNDRLHELGFEKGRMAAEADRARLDTAVLTNRVSVLESLLSSRLALLQILLGFRHPTRDEQVDGTLELVLGAERAAECYIALPASDTIELRGWLKGRPDAAGPATIKIGAKLFQCERYPRIDVARTFGLDPAAPWGFSAILPAKDLPLGHNESWLLIGNTPVKQLGIFSGAAP
ncbi:hypothetical protein [Xanthobacter aminoxidans]|uniref:hypothetical protein n=1 Tax=Xanthobacter aminoxidans TaxID=186280 RepID=UPI002022CAF1|nr:hypothetical protein [Xanthobacter aminoxidans]MCL8382365.1 hypothetical protein [Xanthobacter aminoxidans]